MRSGSTARNVVLLAVLLLAPAELGRPGPPPRSAPPPPLSFGAAIEAAEELPRLHSLLVVRRGERLLESYFHGASARRTGNIKSASKSVISALVGIAIERGLIESVDTPISEFFPELLRPDADPGKRAITVEDLLTMRAGLESTSSRNYGAWVHSRSWVRYALNQPLLNPPGSRMTYSTGNTHLLSAILTKASGGSTWKLASEALAKPLGFELARWPRDPEGIYFGGNDMEMTPRQMAAFGELYVNRGRAGDSQIIPGEWVDASFTPVTRSRRSGRLYGYGWWMRTLAGRRVHFAWGFGGQFIFVVPDLELVVVTTSSAVPGPGRRGHLGAVYDLVGSGVIAPVAASLGYFTPALGAQLAARR